MTDLKDLARRVSELQGPSREVDREIWYALQDEMEGDPCHAGCFTASLDAAMMLVPDGWAVERFGIWPASPDGADNVSPPRSFVTLCGTSVGRMGRKMIWGHGSGDRRAEAEATTPALALCAAALTARSEA